MTEHTPGPWEAIKEPSTYLQESDFGSWLINSTGPLKLELAAIISDVPELHESAEANARLIAAAPELLKVTEDHASLLRGMIEIGNGGVWAEEELKTTEKISAKARGKS